MIIPIFVYRPLLTRLAYSRGHSVASITLPLADANRIFIEMPQRCWALEEEIMLSVNSPTD